METQTIIDLDQLAESAGLPKGLIDQLDLDDPTLEDLEAEHGFGGGGRNAIIALLIAQHYHRAGEGSVADDCISTALVNLMGGGGPEDHLSERLIHVLLKNTIRS